MRVEPVMAMCSSNLLIADVWEMNKTVTIVEVMKTGTIFIQKHS
jgi:hypothetical protein